MTQPIKINLETKPAKVIKLKASKTIDGNIMISSHPDMLIVVMPAKNKIVSLPKEQLDDELAASQKRMFDFLVKKGVIDFSSVQDGNLFMTREATIPEVSEKGDKIELCLLALSNFLSEEAPFYENMKEFEREMERKLLEPEGDEYTEFDPNLHSDTKGTLPPRMVKYGIHSIYRV